MQHHIVKQAEAELTAASLHQISVEDRLIAGLYFYERLTVDEISIVLEADTESIRTSLNNVFSALLSDEPESAAKQKSSVVSAHLLG